MTLSWLGLPLESLLLVMGIVFVAGIVRGLTGFGLAVVLVPLVNLVVAPERTVLLAILIGCLSGFLGYRAAWRSVDRPLVMTITVAAVVATPLGLFALFRTPPDVARLAIAVIAVTAFFAVILPRPPLPPPGRLPAIMTGLLAGLLGAFAAIPGPPVIHYFSRTGVPPAQTRDAMIVIFLWGPLAVASFAFLAGKLDWSLALLALACFPALALGNAIGTRNFGRIPERQWRLLILAIIAGSACGAVLKLI